MFVARSSSVGVGTPERPDPEIGKIVENGENGE